MNEVMIRTEGVGRSFRSGAGGEEFWALKDIGIQVPRGKLTILRGRSGSGKTTLMNILGALDKPTRGKVYFGEMTFTPSGGITHYYSEQGQKELGEMIVLDK